MKVHYINILLFALPLNILKHNQRNHKNPTPHTQTNRSLCECELYAPANYDSDPQMKSVMENFNKQTQQRLHEYDERMKTTRQKCKDKCDKEIQKIILKDKLEKELMDKFATLQTDIQSDAIPTCVCEKSLADKTEQFCLNCGVNVGGGVTLSSGVLGAIGASAVTAWKPKALEAAITAAKEAAAVKIVSAAKAAGNAKGMEIVTTFLEKWSVNDIYHGICEEISRIGHFTRVTDFAEIIFAKKEVFCSMGVDTSRDAICRNLNIGFGIKNAAGDSIGPPGSTPIIQTLNGLVVDAEGAAAKAAEAESTRVIAGITKKQTALIEGGFNSSITSIYAAIIAIVVIVLIMVIIYKILRYRRKKKMKKKLQYIKLLKE
ncbi:rifin [Plasmodium reichenowi]|uniref:Rifin n=1 Tax=Plasmodium reichenowi TaxID=5854 RepID=A0A060RM75_PLARE|nr:rifin [Plasmodium reichenowi]